MSNIDEKISLTILSKAYKHFSLNPLTNIGCSIGLMNKTDVYNWKCTLVGPNDSPYKGGYFKIFLKFPKTFPKDGPEVIFNTPIFHLNVNPVKTEGQDLGHVCVSTVNFWNPDSSIEDLLVSIFALFYKANIDSAYRGYGEDVLKEFTNDRAKYDQRVKYFTKKYANGKFKCPELTRWDFTMDN